MLPELLRSMEADRSIPVIVLSGDATTATAEKLLTAGAGAVLAKPADPGRLVEEIHRLLKAKRPSLI